MLITPQEALQRCVEHREIFHDEMLRIMRMIMSGEMSPVMMAALISALRVKKETVGEIAAAAQVMREFATPVKVHSGPNFVDIVGTGGDAAHTFNISTASMFVASAAGAQVAKHGGRSVSSKSGSADVLEALGACITLDAGQVGRCIDEIGLGFMFAPNLQHPRPAHQPGRRTQHPDGGIPPRLGRYPDPGAAKSRRPSRTGGLGAGRDGRDLAGCGHDRG
jgi:anthranilate phosphoribosyltransferase